MKSLKVPVEGPFFSKELKEHQISVAQATGRSPWEIDVRYLSYDVGAKEAIIFYELAEDAVEVTIVEPGTPEWDASEIALEKQRLEGG
jgi:hypothetical protein